MDLWLTTLLCQHTTVIHIKFQFVWLLRFLKSAISKCFSSLLLQLFSGPLNAYCCEVKKIVHPKMAFYDCEEINSVRGIFIFSEVTFIFHLAKCLNFTRFLCQQSLCQIKVHDRPETINFTNVY